MREEDVEWAFDMGAHSFLVKPVNMADNILRRDYDDACIQRG
jgi:hypothetical protein